MQRASKTLIAITISLITLGLLPQCGWLGDVKAKVATQNTQSINLPPGNGTPQLLLYTQSPVPAGSCNAATLNYAVGGQTAQVPTSTVVTLVGSSVATFYTNSSCSSPTGQVVLPANGTSTGFYVSFSQPGTFVIAAIVQSGSPAQSALYYVGVTGQGTGTIPVNLSVTGPTSVGAGTCNAYSASLYNNQNTPASFSSSTTLQLSGGGTGTYYGNSGCSGSATTTFTVPAGTSSTTFYYKNNSTGTSTLQASQGGLNGSLVVISGVGAPAKITLTGLSTVYAGDCNMYTVTVTDQGGNPSPFPVASSISTSVNGLGTLYSNSNCSSAITGINLAAFTPSAPVYYKSTQTGNATLNAVPSVNGIQSGSLNVAIVSAPVGAAAKLVWNSGNNTTAGTCYGPVSVGAQDSNGNVLNGSIGITANLSNSGSAKYYSDSNCGSVITSAAVNTSFYLRDTKAETISLIAQDAANHVAGANLSFTVNPGVRINLAFVGSPSSFAAGFCQPFIVAFTDAYGNGSPVAGSTDVTLTQTGTPMGGLYGDTSCSGQLSMTGQGSSLNFPANTAQKTFYYKAAKIGVGFLKASSTGVNEANTQFTVTPGGPARIQLIHSPNPLTAGVCSSNLSPGDFLFGLFDAFGNKTAANAPMTFNLNITAGQGSFYVASSCSGSTTTTISFPQGIGEASVYFKPMSTPMITINVTGGGLPDYPINIPVNGGGPAQLVLTGPDSGLVNQCLGLQLQVKDANGNPANITSGIAVTLNNSGPKVGFLYQDANCGVILNNLNYQGSSANFYFKGIGAGANNVTAASPGLNMATKVISLNAGPATSWSVNGPSSGNQKSCAGPFEVKFFDAFGNPTTAGGLSFTLLGGGQGHFYSSNACTTIISSIVTQNPWVSATFYFKDDAAETVTLQLGSSILNPNPLTKNFCSVSTCSGSRTFSGDPFEIRGFVDNTLGNATIPWTPQSCAALNDASTAQKICSMTGYSRVISYGCSSPQYGRCNFQSTGDDCLVGWNGSGWATRNAGQGQWLAQLSCGCP